MRDNDRARPAKDIAEDWQKMFKAELRLIEQRKVNSCQRPDKHQAGSPGRNGRSYLTGMALSGGGIRSATVCLGVMQAFASAGLLKHVDYLSSVSGGGYTGATVALRYAQGDKDSDPDEAFPFGKADTSPENPELARLRQHANYLAPEGLRGIATGVFVVARSILINLFIWITIGAGVMALLMLFADAWISGPCRVLPRGLLPRVPPETCGVLSLFDTLLLVAAGLGTGIVMLMVGFSLSSWRMKTGLKTTALSNRRLSRFYVLAAAAFFILTIVFIRMTRGSMPAPLPDGAQPLSVSLAILAVLSLLAFLATLAICIGPRLFRQTLDAMARKYARRRFQEGFSGGLLLFIAALLVVGSLPVVPDLLGKLPGFPAGSPPMDPGLFAQQLRLPPGSVPVDPEWFAQLLRRAPGSLPTDAEGIADLLRLPAGSPPVDPNLLSEVLERYRRSPPNPGPTMILTYLVALGTALFGFYRTHLRGTLGIGSAFLLVAGSAFVCWGALFASYRIAEKYMFHSFRALGGEHLLIVPQVLPLLALIIAIALGFFVNLNDVSLGRFYRDRLMEAFMPNLRRTDDGKLVPAGTKAAGTADRFLLSEVIGPLSNRAGPRYLTETWKPLQGLLGFLGNGSVGHSEKTRLLGPYPLINTNVMTPGHADPVARERGGDSFVLAPAWCGSSATGWMPTTRMMRGRMHLSTAMAISGAAANPRGGFAGTGPTTSHVVAVAMSLLSVRLGYWLRWNSAPPVRTWLNPFGNHFVPSAWSLVRPPSSFIELTDGGHFENLGIYELVRRRCGLIVVCDGGDDRLATYASLTAAARWIEEDFGVTFAFDFQVRNDATFEDSGPQQVVARSVDDDYPKGAEFASRGYFLASVRYPAPTTEQRVPMARDGPQTGLVIYLKSAMIRSLSLTSRGYKGANDEFPYESTADQFFSPEQFEAYRDVGVRIANQMLEDTNLAHLFDGIERPSLRTLRNTYGFTTASDWQPWT